MKHMLYSVITLSILVFSGCKNEEKKVEKQQGTQVAKPNVLFILADDYGYHDLSITGSKFYETPNIDRIAKEGMSFTNGYAASRVCSPSRASIMLGTFTARHGITDWIGAKAGTEWRKTGRFNKLLPADYEHKLPAEAITLPEAMKAAGYKTFFAGKWHLGEKGSWPEDHGFDINIGGWDAGSPNGGYFSPYNNPNLENRKDGENLSMRLAEETVTFLKENDPNKTGKPVFAYLSFYAVHGPIQTTKEKWAKYRKKAVRNGVADSGYKMAKFLPIRQVQDNPVYAGLVETMDDAVGRVLNTLDSLGLDKNTLVVFTSDNGGVSAGDSFSTSNLPLRGGKGYQFEGGIREPYFIKAPWLVKGGASTSEPVTGADLYPTILDVVGADLKPEQHLDGKSLLPILKGGHLEERALFWHYPHYGNQGGEPSSVIRKGDWKLIHYYEDGREELYNLKNDLQELSNVASENPELTKQLSEQLFAYLDDVGARYPEKDPDYDPKKEAAYLKKIEEVKMPALEKQRRDFLSADFDPKDNWWGSNLTKD
ncbi:sulfatase [Zobellia galactanivorans]|uniref:sulfatase n=1 Tax=Zobellia TaxID=112040 RepID=UPI000B749D88|nr:MULTISPECIES: sulfatase [Zobellia]MDO6808128.1 sulfatase [Zobellia galactanivorans]OWW25019.1 sulfatase [Zobellia sp. OII3]